MLHKRVGRMKCSAGTPPPSGLSQAALCPGTQTRWALPACRLQTFNTTADGTPRPLAHEQHQTHPQYPRTALRYWQRNKLQPGAQHSLKQADTAQHATGASGAPS